MRIAKPLTRNSSRTAALLTALSLAPLADAALPNGVASGDVTQDSAMLWTRADAAGPVTIELSTDPAFGSILDTLNLSVTDPLVPVKGQVTGLTAGTAYYYRATAGGASASGQFVTPAPAGVRQGLTIALLTDWQQAPPYPVLSNVPASEPDLLLKLGDTIFADTETPASSGFITPGQARTLDEFRIKHEEVLSARPGGATTGPFTNYMIPVYASASILSTIDDHEITDNFAGGAAPGLSPDAPDIGAAFERLFTDGVDTPGPDPANPYVGRTVNVGSPVPATANFVNETTAYIEALQAYDDYHPINTQVWTGTGDPRMEGKPKLYRHVQYGADASVTMLDSRSFRDDQLPVPTNVLNPVEVQNFFTASFNPGRTLLGRAQVDQLKADLAASQAAGQTWKFVTIPEPIQEFGIVNAEDRFEGYAAERAEILAFIDQAGIENVVFLAGDFHGNIVNQLSYTVPTPGGLVSVETNAFEIVTGPVAFESGRFGPNVANIGAAAGLITPQELAFYNSLPIAPDGDDLPNDKDDFIKSLVDAQIALSSLGGPNPIGLDDAALIDATLLQGDYLSSHVFQWTELDIDPVTGVLTVTTWGIDSYSEQDVLDAIANDDLSAIEDLALSPVIVSQFSVVPVPEPTSLALLGLGGLVLGRRRR